MARKEWRLILRDVSFYFTGNADVAAADWKRDPWLYPLDWTYQLDREADYFEPKDTLGIPLRRFAPPIGDRYLPSRVAGYGFAHWNRGSEPREVISRDRFMTVAHWFRDTHDEGRYFYDIRIAGKTEPWISCIAQGEAASILTRAHRLTNDSSFLAAAHTAVRWLLVAEKNGGLQSILPDGRPFLEEYPGTVYRHVLNGCLYAAVGIHDVIREDPVNSRELAQFFGQLVDAIAANLGHWDVSGWSTYDYLSATGAARNLNTMTYQLLQVFLLQYLADVSGNDALAAGAARWRRSANRLPMRLGALAGKLAYRLKSRW
jgi:heparosan-N-sulfate-glucuronate 5-epimerase